MLEVSSSNELIVNIDQMLPEFCDKASTPSIHRVNDCLRNTNEKAYDPMIISIGPLHQGKPHLKAMEQHKMRYLKQLLGNSSIFCTYLNTIRNMEQTARDFYSHEIELDTNQFVKMLLLDGIFIIEFLREYSDVDGGGIKRDGNPIFGFEYVVSHLLRDLMLFENQIPIFVVEALFQLSNHNNNTEFKDLIWPLTKCSKKDVASALLPNDATRPKHLLGLVHSVKCFSFAQLRSHSNSAKRCEKKNINSATDLKEAGIVFKKKAKGEDCSWLDITFENRTLYIPELVISDEMESLFKNMIAYEFYLPGSSPKYVSDYVYFLHCLVSNSKDAEVLRRYGVISNWLGGDARVYEVIVRLGTHAFKSRRFSYEGVFGSINEHCGRKWNKWIAVLRRHHFNNPWTVLSLFAAVVLLAVSIVQMVFAVLSFYKKT
ncbi:hypothetical protein SASPL_145451 [Salvia splendens]|uniref:Uncharacterized protein n=1 Tax=Salvia splendens TaxID=180675 RepID=A0A8X8WJ35_SALSN|nr:UPF0481 protein At3g47200-like [Salvia splendens]XP_042026889.1 UPF0481 protein At3g47200-like [Salvia splendens]KAG6394861.1 hypothetical protein SASPL_145451 [Salvia splendens]